MATKRRIMLARIFSVLVGEKSLCKDVLSEEGQTRDEVAEGATGVQALVHLHGQQPQGAAVHPRPCPPHRLCRQTSAMFELWS